MLDPYTGTWRDITDRFEFLSERLEHVDGPWEGLIRSRETGELFAFRCTQVIADHLWHWALVPLHSADTPVAKAFDAAQRAPTDWLSIVEDRRSTEPRLFPALLNTAKHTLPDLAKPVHRKQAAQAPEMPDTPSEQQ
jgi:hypothetical protein